MHARRGSVLGIPTLRLGGILVLIAGETHEYAICYFLDADVGMIETGHSVSENFRLREFSEIMKQHYPEAKIVFFERERPWQSI